MRPAAGCLLLVLCLLLVQSVVCVLAHDGKAERGELASLSRDPVEVGGGRTNLRAKNYGRRAGLSPAARRGSRPGLFPRLDRKPEPVPSEESKTTLHTSGGGYHRDSREEEVIEKQEILNEPDSGSHDTQDEDSRSQGKRQNSLESAQINAPTAWLPTRSTINDRENTDDILYATQGTVRYRQSLVLRPTQATGLFRSHNPKPNSELGISRQNAQSLEPLHDETKFKYWDMTKSSGIEQNTGQFRGSMSSTNDFQSSASKEGFSEIEIEGNVLRSLKSRLKVNKNGEHPVHMVKPLKRPRGVPTEENHRNQWPQGSGTGGETRSKGRTRKSSEDSFLKDERALSGEKTLSSPTAKQRGYGEKVVKKHKKISTKYKAANFDDLFAENDEPRKQFISRHEDSYSNRQHGSNNDSQKSFTLSPETARRVDNSLTRERNTFRNKERPLDGRKELLPGEIELGEEQILPGDEEYDVVALRQGKHESQREKPRDTFLRDEDNLPRKTPRYRALQSDMEEEKRVKPATRSSETFLTDEEDHKYLHIKPNPHRTTNSPQVSGRPLTRSEESFLTDSRPLSPKIESYMEVTHYPPSISEYKVPDEDNFLRYDEPNPTPPSPPSIRNKYRPQYLGRVRWPPARSAESDESNRSKPGDLKPLFYEDFRSTRNKTREKSYEDEVTPSREETEEEDKRGKPDSYDYDRPPSYEDHHPLLELEDSSGRPPSSTADQVNEQESNAEEEQDKEGDEDSQPPDDVEDNVPLNGLDSEESLGYRSNEGNNEGADPASGQEEVPGNGSSGQEQYSQEAAAPDDLSEGGPPGPSQEGRPPSNAIRSNEESGTFPGLENSEESGDKSRGEYYDERPPDYDSIRPTTEYEEGGSRQDEETGGSSSEDHPDYSEEESGGEPDYTDSSSSRGNDYNSGSTSGEQSGGASPEFNFDDFEFPDDMTERPPLRTTTSPRTRPLPGGGWASSRGQPPADCPDEDDFPAGDFLKTRTSPPSSSTLRPADQVSFTIENPFKFRSGQSWRGEAVSTTTTLRPVTISVLGVVKPDNDIISRVVLPTPSLSSSSNISSTSTSGSGPPSRPGLRSAKIRAPFGSKVKERTAEGSSGSTPTIRTTVRPGLDDFWKAVLRGGGGGEGGGAREEALTYLRPPPVGQQPPVGWGVAGVRQTVEYTSPSASVLRFFLG